MTEIGRYVFHNAIEFVSGYYSWILSPYMGIRCVHKMQTAAAAYNKSFLKNVFEKNGPKKLFCPFSRDKIIFSKNGAIS